MSVHKRVIPREVSVHRCEVAGREDAWSITVVDKEDAS